MLTCGLSKPWPQVVYASSSQASWSPTGPNRFELLSYFCGCPSTLATPPLPMGRSRRACFSALCFGFISSFTSNLDTFPDFHPQSYYFFWPYYILLLLSPCFPLVLSIVSLTLALAFLLGVSLSPSSSSLLSASLHMAFVLTYETAYPSLEWTLPYYVVFVTKYFMCIVESSAFYSM